MPKPMITNQASTSFDPKTLTRARDLQERVRTERWDTCTMPAEEERLLCAMWVSEARALLDDPSLPSPDRNACLWVLTTVKKIIDGAHFIHGLSRRHEANWNQRTRRLRTILEGKRAQPRAPGPSRKARIDRPSSTNLIVSPEIASLHNARVVIVGDEEDDVVLDHFEAAGVRVEWVTGNIRRLQAGAERIRRGQVDGVVFLTDQNGHIGFAIIRAACRASGTPMVLGTKGLSGVLRAVERLSEDVTRSA